VTLALRLECPEELQSRFQEAAKRHGDGGAMSVALLACARGRKGALWASKCKHINLILKLISQIDKTLTAHDEQ
jgi:hypothetical protein